MIVRLDVDPSVIAGLFTIGVYTRFFKIRFLSGTSARNYIKVGSDKASILILDQSRQ